MKPIFAAFALTLAGCVSNTPSNETVGLPPNSTLIQVSQDAASAFVAACVNTAQSPNSAPSILLSRGFVDKGTRDGRLRFESATATAALSNNTNGGGLGQCSVTPKGGNFSASVAALNQQVRNATVSVRKLPNEEAWLIGATGAVALISRSRGAMTRTQPNVFRN